MSLSRPWNWCGSLQPRLEESRDGSPGAFLCRVRDQRRKAILTLKSEVLGREKPNETEQVD